MLEGAELLWLGFHPLEAVFAAVGVAVAGMALSPITKPLSGDDQPTRHPLREEVMR